MDVVEVGGLRIAYERAGAGPAVVLLHGYVSDGPTTWRPQLDGLCDEFTVVAWDAPGAGGSGDPPEGFGTTGYADCLAGFVAALDLETPDVVGLSFGAIVALALNHRHPGVARSLVLASGYAGWGGSLPAAVAEARLRQALVLADRPPGDLMDALAPTMFQPMATGDAVTAFRRSMLDFHPAGFRAMARASSENLRHVLPGVDVPTLLVHGGKDVRAGLPVAHDLESAIARARLVVLPEAGHLCNIEAPDEFNDVVRRFLRNAVP